MSLSGMRSMMGALVEAGEENVSIAKLSYMIN